MTVFLRLKPREPERFNRTVFPKNETLKKLCFFTVSSEKFFDILIDCLWSIKSTRLYQENNIPICVLSTGRFGGLTDEQKKYLRNVLEIKYIEDINEKHESIKTLGDKADAYNSGNVSRVFIDYYFPEFEYFLNIEHDCWIYDDTYLDMVIDHCEKYGLSYPINLHVGVSCKNFQKKEVMKSIQEKTLENIKKNKNTFGDGYRNRKTMEEFNIPTIQPSVYHFPRIDASENDNLLPCIYKDQLVNPINLERISVIHLRGKYKHREIFDAVPTMKIEKPLSGTKLEQHYKLTWDILNGCVLKKLPEGYTDWMSLHFCSLK